MHPYVGSNCAVAGACSSSTADTHNMRVMKALYTHTRVLLPSATPSLAHMLLMSPCCCRFLAPTAGAPRTVPGDCRSLHVLYLPSLCRKGTQMKTSRTMMHHSILSEGCHCGSARNHNAVTSSAMRMACQCQAPSGSSHHYVRYRQQPPVWRATQLHGARVTEGPPHCRGTSPMSKFSNTKCALLCFCLHLNQHC
jgi:hypothetical protein